MAAPTTSFKIPCENCNLPLVVDGPARPYEECHDRICEICARSLLGLQTPLSSSSPENEQPEERITLQGITNDVVTTLKSKIKKSEREIESQKQFATPTTTSATIHSSGIIDYDPSIYDPVKQSCFLSADEESTSSYPILIKLKREYYQFHSLLEIFNKFKIKLTYIHLEIDGVIICDPRLYSNLLKKDVRSLLEKRNNLLHRARELKEIIPQAYAKISLLIQQYEDDLLGLADGYIKFHAFLNNQHSSEAYKKYEKLCEVIKSLKELKENYECAWDSVNSLWKETTKKIRYLNNYIEQKALPRFSFALERPWTGPDAQGVISFNWGLINPDSARERGWFFLGTATAAPSIPISLDSAPKNSIDP